jgi:branched-subunit amino acid aminotransferase/4-amino-4-deoxychorismate lyase
MIPRDDRGLLLGDGLFETLLARDGELVDAAAHLDRMAVGCAALGLPGPDRGEATRLMRQAVAGTLAPRAAVRLTLTAGSGGRGLDRPHPPQPRLFATATPALAPTGPVRLIISGVRRNEGSPTARLKTLAYLDNVLARAEAQAAGAGEALMLNNRGELACATAANLFWLREGALETPALDCGVLAGIVRAAVMSRARALGIEVREVRAGVGTLATAEAMFLTNSLIGVRPAAALADRPFAPHPLLAALAAGVAP